MLRCPGTVFSGGPCQCKVKEDSFFSNAEVAELISQNAAGAVGEGKTCAISCHSGSVLQVDPGKFRIGIAAPGKFYDRVIRGGKYKSNLPDNLEIIKEAGYKNVMVDTDGGLGLVPSSNIGADYAMFEAVHGSAPDIAGKHLANPTAFLWSACMMLEYLGENETAARIRKAVDEVLAEGKHLTRDLHGEASTEEYVDAVIARL